MRVLSTLVALLLFVPGIAEAQDRPTVLFIGNSFTYGHGSPVRYYRADTVTDLNDEGIGGVPALFKSFADQAGLAYDVYLETRGGSGFEFHTENKRDVIARPWDVVVMHGQSTLDLDNPGDPTKFMATSQELAALLYGENPDVDIYLTATWSRADLTYPSDGHWHGQPIEALALEVRAAYDEAASRAPGVRSVNPVGEAWTRAMQTGVADPNPYDGIEVDQVDLWTFDHYHASTEGYYLEALVVFGNVTGVDPRSLGRNECSGFELGMAPATVEVLQQVAADQLTAEGVALRTPEEASAPTRAARCLAPQ